MRFDIDDEYYWYWKAGNAEVHGNAEVTNDALVFGNAEVSE